MPSKHYEHMDACAKCDEEWPCRDQLFDDIDRLTAALAASDADNQRLREAIKRITDFFAMDDPAFVRKWGSDWANMTGDELAAAWRALLAPGADAGADLPPLPPLASYPVTVEISDIRQGQPLPPTEDDDTRAAREN